MTRATAPLMGTATTAAGVMRARKPTASLMLDISARCWLKAVSQVKT